MSEYNLLDERWILVRDKQGRTRALSLLEVFKQANDIVSLANELPTLDAAILRLLLSIMHASLSREMMNYHEAIGFWVKLWTDGLPIEKIANYLEEWRDRFYLFDEKYPFYQIVFGEQPQGITFTYKTANNLNGEMSEPDKDSPNMFGGRSNRDTLTYAEAARWLVHLNSFDIAPAGSPGKVPLRVKGFGLGYLNQIGLVWLNGSNLFQTLLLNFVVFRDGCDPKAENSPSWEHFDVMKKDRLESIEITSPTNLSALYTIQWRRIRLLRNSGYVTGYELWGGCRMNTSNAFIEPMTMWKLDKDGSYKPLIHDSARMLWRDFHSLFIESGAYGQPGIASWMNDIENENPTLKLPMLKFCTASMKFTKSTKVNDSFSDVLSFNADMLSKIGTTWIARICELLSITDEAVKALGSFASDLSEATGDKRDKQGRPSPAMAGKRDAAKAEAYFRLDEPFRSWLEDINPQIDKITTKLDRWNDITFKILSELGEELVAQAGMMTFIGVYPSKGSGRLPINSSIAYNRYISRLYKLLKKGDTAVYEQ